MSEKVSARRELTLFLLGPGLLAAGIALIFSIWPWPVFSPSQAELFSLFQTGGYLAVGAAGAAACSRIGVPSTPALSEGRRWASILFWSLLLGLAYGAFDLSLYILWPNPEGEAATRAAGITWSNVALPWSVAHYAHASILTECAFRLGLVAVPTWLVSHVLLKGRGQSATFWIFAVLVAFIEPLGKSLALKQLPLLGMPLHETLLTIEGVIWQLVFAWLLRRCGWSAPMLMRFAFYLLFRVTAGYFFPPDSLMYPGPH